MKIEQITVTPSMARTWLSISRMPNRPINKSFVDYLRGEILGGRWRMTHQGIALQEDPFGILDGQHRLSAIAESEVAVPVMVVWGLDASDALFAVDQGRARMFSHLVLMREPGTKNAVRMAALARSLIKLLGGDQNPSPSCRFEALDSYKDEIALVAGAMASAPVKPRTPAMVPFVLELKADHRNAETWMDQVLSGAGLLPGDPFLLLRNRWIAGRSGSGRPLSEVPSMGLTIAALDAKRSNDAQRSRLLTGGARYRAWCGRVGIAPVEWLANAFTIEKASAR